MVNNKLVLFASSACPVGPHQESSCGSPGDVYMTATSADLHGVLKVDGTLFENGQKFIIASRQSETSKYVTSIQETDDAAYYLVNGSMGSLVEISMTNNQISHEGWTAFLAVLENGDINSLYSYD